MVQLDAGRVAKDVKLCGPMVYPQLSAGCGELWGSLQAAPPVVNGAPDGLTPGRKLPACPAR